MAARTAARSIPALTGSDLARFWTKVDTSGPCWEWTAARDGGYGKFGHDGRALLAHRVAWFALTGEQPAGTLDHLCRNRACVNPDHLEPVAPRINVRRGAVPRLTDAVAAEIRARYASGDGTYRSLASDYGVSSGTVWAVLQDKTWRAA